LLPLTNGSAQTYNQYHSALVSAAALLIDNSLDDLENKFAPVSPSNSDTWLDILLNLISMGTPMAGGKFFTSGKISIGLWMKR